MSNNAYFYGGPLDGLHRGFKPMAAKVQADFIDAATGAVYKSIPKLSNPKEGMYWFNHAETITLNKPPLPAGQLPEVTVHGQKLMTLGQLAQFLDAARQAGYPEDHVPRVVNSFSGRIRALTAKDKRRADHTE